jgi:VanZ family protein
MPSTLESAPPLAGGSRSLLPRFLRKSAVAAFLARYRLWISGALFSFWLSMFIGTHIPRIPSALEEVSDKTLHFLSYSGLAFLLALAAASWGKMSLRRAPLLLGVLATYGALDELSQIPVHRDASVWDWTADLGGSILGLTAFFLVRRLAQRLCRTPEEVSRAS